MEAFYAAVDARQDEFVASLKEAVAIASVSADVAHRPQVVAMGHWLKERLEGLGASVTLHHPGQQILEGQSIPLPPILLGRLGNSPAKKTVAIYGHYDVQPASKSDGWDTDPWVLTEDASGRLLGRGSTDDKGPILGWLWAIQTFQSLGMELPVNLLFCFEGMEESGSEGLDELIQAEAKGFFSTADCVVISDNYWLGTKKPCLTYGLRGISYYTLTVCGPAKDLHSGVFGGVAHEPMTDLIQIMSKLVDNKGKILIPGIYDTVAPVTPEELNLYEALDFSITDIYASIGNERSISAEAKDSLMARWRFPSLSLHGIEGAFYGPGAKTVIPAKVIGKFSIRTVPDQSPEVITGLVQKYIQTLVAAQNTKCTVSVECGHAGKWWIADPNHWNYVAGRKAVEAVFGVTPDFTREGGSIPVTLTFQECLQKNVLLLPMGRADDGAHSINEKLDRSNYIQGIKLLGTYLQEIAKVSD